MPMPVHRIHSSIATLLVRLAPAAALFAIAVPAAAAPPPPVLRDIEPSTPSSVPKLVGTAQPGSTVVVFASNDCNPATVLPGNPTQIGGSGELSFVIPAFTSMTYLSAHATDASGTSACSRKIGYYPEHALECPALPGDLPQTRRPIFSSIDPYQMFFAWARDCHAASCPPAPNNEFGNLFDEIVTDRPALCGLGGFAGELPFSAGYLNGVPKGLPIPGQPTVLNGIPSYIYGGPELVPQTIDAGVLSPEDLSLRIAEHQQYMQLYQGVTKRYIYTDFGTKITGNHVTRTGFFDFYDNHWDAFVAAGFDLGPKPEDPTRWLRASYHGRLERPSFPSILTGLSFDYDPLSTVYSPYHRYAANITSNGWALWWKQVMQWGARAGFPLLFIDNVMFRSCFNTECQLGYEQHLQSTYGAAETQRLFTESTSLMHNPGFEVSWTKTASGDWDAQFAARITGHVYPDIDSALGAYAARIESGTLRTFSGTLAAGRHTLTVSYKTEPGVPAELKLVLTGLATNTEVIVPLPASAVWTTTSVDVMAAAGEYLLAYYTTPGTLWVDEQILTDYTADGRGGEWPNHPRYTRELVPDAAFPNHVRFRASVAYWDSVVDERLTYLRDAGREIDPEFSLFTNSLGRQRRGADYFMFERVSLESEWLLRDTKHFPGVYRPGGELDGLPVEQEILNTNVFGYKHVHARRLTDTFAYSSHLAHDPGVPYMHNPDSVLLQLAEGAAFGGGSAIDPLLSQLKDRYPAADRAVLRGEVRGFFDFANDHPELFTCLRSHAEVGFVVHDLPSADHERKLLHLIKGIAGSGVLWDVLPADRVTSAALGRYRAVVVREVDHLSETEAQRLADFAAGGGTLILIGEIGTYDELGRLRAARSSSVWPPVPLGNQAAVVSHGAGTILWYPDPDDAGAAALMGGLAQHVRPSPSAFPGLSGTTLERMRIAAWEGPDRLVLHLVDYDVALGPTGSGKTMTDVDVEVPLPASGLVPTTARIHDPRTGGAVDVPVSVASGVAKLSVPSMKVYAIADLR